MLLIVGSLLTSHSILFSDFVIAIMLASLDQTN
jgi:hypothetical protein